MVVVTMSYQLITDGQARRLQGTTMPCAWSRAWLVRQAVRPYQCVGDTTLLCQITPPSIPDAQNIARTLFLLSSSRL